MGKFKCLMNGLIIAGSMALSLSALANASLSFEWAKPDGSVYQHNCLSHNASSCVLDLVAGSNIPVVLTITNTSTKITARDIQAVLPPEIAENVKNSANCAKLLPSQQCQMTFTPSNTYYPATDIIIRGNNTSDYRFVMAVIANAFTVGGTVTGLTAQGLVLQNNGIDNLFVPPNGMAFQFSTPIVAGGSYHVTVSSQPQGLFCSVINDSGTNVTANISNISVSCIPSNKFAYIPNYNAQGTVSVCSIEQKNGLLKTNPACSAVLSGLSFPSNVVINPAKTAIYIIDSLSSNKKIVNCVVNAYSGGLLGCQSSDFPSTPKVITFNASSTRAYVTDSQNVYLCAVNAITRRLGACHVTGPSLTALSSIALSHGGTKALLTDSATNSIVTASINPSDGELDSASVITPSVLFSAPQGITVNSTGTFLYVTNNGTKKIVFCAINSDGLPVNCATTGLANIFSGNGKLTFNATGTKAYIPYANVNPVMNLVYVCDVDKTTGELSNCIDSQGAGFNAPAGVGLY